MPSDPVVAAREMQRLLVKGPRTSFDVSWFRHGDRVLTPAEIVEILRPFLTEERIARIDEVLAERTYNLTVVVEGLVDSGNVSAVMRTAEAFGVQSFHAVDTATSYKHSRRTSQGAEKWLDRYRWNTAEDCVAALQATGHRIVAAHLDDGAVPIASVDFSMPTALVLGNELGGLSPALVAAADVTAMIPISGFVQSFNISVAAALCLLRARDDRVERLGRHGDLLPADLERLRAVFAMKSVRHHRQVIARALDQGGSAPT